MSFNTFQKRPRITEINPVICRQRILTKRGCELRYVSLGIATPIGPFLLHGLRFTGEKENVPPSAGLASDPNFPTHSSLGHE